METVMNAPQPSFLGKGLGRSIGAVAAGLVTIVVTHTLADAVMHRAGVFPPAGKPMSDGLFALAVGYRVLLSIGGAYVTARLAPSSPRKHALVLAGIGLVLSTLGVIARLAVGPELGPLWYPLVLVLVTVPCCLAGALLRGDRS
jgi:hypothetical protein